MLTISSSATESVGSGDTGRNLEGKMKNQGINPSTAHRTSWVTGMGPVGVSGFASLSKGRLTVKKLFASLLIGALVSLGCGQSTKTSSAPTKAEGSKGEGAPKAEPSKKAETPAPKAEPSKKAETPPPKVEPKKGEPTKK